MENENKKKRRSVFNLFDLTLLIAAALLGVVLFLGSRDRPAGTAAGDPVPIRYTVQIADVEPWVAELVKEGDLVVDREKKYNLGAVESVEIGPAERTVTDYTNGRQVLAGVPGHCSALVTVETEGVLDERSITLDGGYVLRVGKTVYAKVPGGVFQATVVAIERVDSK